MSKHFAGQGSSGGKVKFELDLSKYATKPDFKNAASVDTLKFAKKVCLASLKSNVDKIDIGKLKKCTKWFKQFKK